MTDTINNQIPFVPENTIDPAAGLNLSLNTVDALLQVLVQTVGANTPPTGIEGQRFIVGTAPTGAWAGQANKLARFLGGAWQFFDARHVLNAADGMWYVRQSTAWITYAGPTTAWGSITGTLSAQTDLQSALDGKVGAADPRLTDSRAPTGGAGGVLSGTYPNPGFAVDMATQAELESGLAGKVDKITGKGLSTEDYTTAEKAKLGGIAADATANATDAQLRDRSTHTGSQAISTVAGLQAALDGKLASTANAVSATKLATARTINGVAFDGTANITIGADWSNVANKPATYAPSAHTHAMTDIIGLSAALDGKQSQVTDIEIRQWMGV